MSTRSRRALAITFSNIGRGTVVTNDPPEALLVPPENGSRRVNPTISPRTYNLRLLNGLATVRPGYSRLAPRISARTVNGTYQALFEDTAEAIIRADTQKIHRLAAGAWVDISGAFTATGAAQDRWSFAMVARSGGPPGNQLILTNGIDAVQKWVGAGNIAAVAGGPPSNARIVVAHLQRCFLLYTTEGTHIHSMRVRWSIAGDSDNWTGLGSGAVDLDSDPWPIANAVVVGARMIVFKGDSDGGSVWLGTPTGQPLAPNRWDPIDAGSGVGLLLPHSLRVTPFGIFFVGHDGFYLYDGSRQFSPVGHGVDLDILSRINQDALRAAFSWYKPRTKEVYVAFPMGGSSSPSEVWVFNVKTKQVYGPLEYKDAMYSAASFVLSGEITWDTMPDTDWDNVPYVSWDTAGEPAGAKKVLFGDEIGEIWEDTDGDLTDDGAYISAEYTLPTVRAQGWVVALGGQVVRELDAHDLLTLYDFTLVYQGVGTWTPVVTVSVDGGATFTTISDGVALADASDRILQVTYSTEINGKSFIIKIANSSGGRMALYNAVAEFSYAGSDRNS